MAECWHRCPYTIIADSVNRHVSLTGFTGFTPSLMRHITMSTIEITAFKWHIEAWLIQSMALWSVYHSVELTKGAWVEFRDQLAHNGCHRRWRQLSWLEAATIRSSQWEKLKLIEMLSRTSFLLVKWVQPPAREATMDETHRHNDDDYRDWNIRHDQQQQSNTISSSQLSAIISPRTYHHRRDGTTELVILRTKGEVQRQLRVGTLATTFHQFGQSALTSIVVYTYNSRTVEAWRTAKTPKAIGRVSEWCRSEMQLPTIHLWTCGQHFLQV